MTKRSPKRRDRGGKNERDDTRAINDDGQCVVTIGDDVPRSPRGLSPQSYQPPDRVRLEMGEE